MKFYFLTGSQHLYGPETLTQVEANSREIVAYLNENASLPYPIDFKGVMTGQESITAAMKAANFYDDCAGVITFCHTFSPSKMWIDGLGLLQKPWLHLHTQYNREIPNTIDMDYMNLHQSAHGDREHGYIGAFLQKPRRVVAGHWRAASVHGKLAKWMQACAGAAFSKTLKIMRFGDNMREVAVTEGNKTAAQEKFGWAVNTFPVGDLVEYVNAVTDAQIKALMDEYKESYTINTDDIAAIEYQARLEIAMLAMLEREGCHAFTNTFEDLHGLRQLPGLATQRLMAKGYGYGGEGDWKTSAMTAILKRMSPEPASFMEDYTYDMGRGLVLGAHMLEVCPTISADRPRIEVHPLGIGGREPPARLVFTGRSGPAVCV
ncbi:MAG: L-arabinose isomerase, partial [Clostridia bacterium]|nr:L-arabinose isomerase [Clostridia bacterium]